MIDMASHPCLLRDKTGFKWTGNELELTGLLDQFQIYGEWKDIEYGKQFVSEEFLKFNWYPQKGKLLIQGDTQKRQKLTSLFQFLIDNPNNLEGAKRVWRKLGELEPIEKDNSEKILDKHPLPDIDRARKACLLRNRNDFKWTGNESELTNLLDQFQIHGEWKNIDYGGRQFVSKDYLQFSLFPQKGTLLVQGTLTKKQKLTSLFQFLIDNPQNFECAKEAWAEMKESNNLEYSNPSRVWGEYQDPDVLVIVFPEAPQ